jgi:hypothetical protein
MQYKVVGVVLSVTRSHCNGYKSAKLADIVHTGRYCDIWPRHSGRSAENIMRVFQAKGPGAMNKVPYLLS